MGMARISTMQDQVEERALLHGGTVFEFAVFVLFSPIDSLVPVFRLSQEISEANAAALASSRGWECIVASPAAGRAAFAGACGAGVA